VDLAAFLRIVADYGWDDLLLAHISARLPDENAYLVNPYGLLFGEVTASSLLKEDFKGQNFGRANMRSARKPMLFMARFLRPDRM
jgi:ribulose-5-phosphate 4-epimerase/fuculose-1-phosphate aldolase